MPTERQKKAVKRIVENGGIVSKAMEEVGYSPRTAKTPQKLTNSKGYKEAAKPFVDRMIKERERLMASLELKELDKVVYSDGVRALDSLTKNIELLSGNATDRSEKDIKLDDLSGLTNEERQERLKTLIIED